MGRFLILIFVALATVGLVRTVAKNPPHFGNFFPRIATSTPSGSGTLPQDQSQQGQIPIIRGQQQEMPIVVPGGGGSIAGGTVPPSVSGPAPETFITSAPRAGSSLETSEITFRFTGQDPWGRRIFFETFVPGLDQDWNSQGASGERTVRFTGGDKDWTFKVRTRTEDGRIDPSPAQITFHLRLSPYFGKIRISNVTRPTSSIFSGTQGTEAVNLAAWGLGTQDAPPVITGWKIETEENVAVIPQAAEIVYADGRDVVKDVVLRSSEQAVVIRGQSPLGLSFKINKCFGWLAKVYQFQPTIFASCPSIPDSSLSGLTGKCREAVKFSANSCSVPDLASFGLQTSAECVGWVNQNLNYGACRSRHQGDSDFLQNEWRLYVNLSTTFVDALHDTVTLRDKSGLFVDRYTY